MHITRDILLFGIRLTGTTRRKLSRNSRITNISSNTICRQNCW